MGFLTKFGIAAFIGANAKIFFRLIISIAIIFIANLELGFLTPPVGMNLFLSAYRFEEPMPRIYRATLPFFLIKLAAVGLITYFPFLTLLFFK